MIARSRFPLRVSASGDCHSFRASFADNQFPKRTPSFLTPFTRRMKIRDTHSCLRLSAPSLSGFSCHVQPPPKRLDAVQSLPLIGAASGLGRVFTFEKSAATNEWGRGNAPGPRLLPDHGFQQPETHLPLPSNSMVRSLIAR